MEKDLPFLQRHRLSLMHQNLNAGEYVQQQVAARVETSFEVELQTAKQKNQKNDGRNFCQASCFKGGEIDFR